LGLEVNPPLSAQQQKLNLARGVFSNGKLPTNFSITLGAAPCNHSCLFCPQSVEKPKKAGFLDQEMLEKVLHEMPEEGCLVNISAYMETLATRGLVEYVATIKRIRPKLEVVMASNGTIFKEDVVTGLMDAGLDIYQYSFDGASRESYAALMQKDDYDVVWKNLERLVAIRDEKKSPMKIYTHIMHFEGVEEDFEKFHKAWKDKLDAVLLRRVANWGSTKLRLAETLAEKGFVPHHRDPETRYPCTSIFMHFKISWDGTYYPCVAAIPQYDHSVPSLGHASEVTFLKAWENLQEMRQAHLEGRWDEYNCCSTCNVWCSWDNMWSRDESDPDLAQSPFYVEGVEHV
jgi:MoaA/NifB/PqqE/SkfB family radical SAM enzyme